MADLNKRKLSDEIVSKINAIEMGLVNSAGATPSYIAHAIGRRHALMTFYQHLSSFTEPELDASDLLGFIEAERKSHYIDAFSIEDFNSPNYEVKKSLDFGKLSEYNAISAHVKDRNEKLEFAD